MTRITESQVRKNGNTGQKYITLSKKSDIKESEHVRVIGLGKNWDKIPGTLKTYNNLEYILTQIVRADNELEERNYKRAKESVDKIREAGELIGEAMDLLDDEFGLVKDPAELKNRENMDWEKFKK